MRADLGPALLTGLYLLAGLGIMVGAGLVRTVRGALPALGMAYVAGLCAVLLVGTWLLAAGIAVSLAVTVAIALVLGIGGLALAVARHRRRGMPPAAEPDARPPSRSRLERVLVAVTAALLVGVLALVLRSSTHMDIAEWDAWSIWTRKALLLFEFGTPSTAFFTDARYATMHADYPLLVPLMEANWFRAAGFADTQGMHAQLWLLLVGFCGAAAWIVGRRGRALVWLPLLLLLVTTPAVRSQLLSGYADIPTALLLGLGVLLVGRWLAHAGRGELGLGVLLLAAAASTKNEGLSAAAAVLAVAVVVAFVLPSPRLGRMRSAAPALLAGVALVGAVLPWRIWMARHGVTGDMPVSQGLDPSFLHARDDRVWPAVKGLVGPLASQGDWQYLLPLGAAAAVAIVAFSAGMRRAGVFYLLSGSTIFASLVWAYWISPHDLAYHLNTSASRTIASVVMVGVAAALHASARAADDDPQHAPAEPEARSEAQDAVPRTGPATPPRPPARSLGMVRARLTGNRPGTRGT